MKNLIDRVTVDGMMVRIIQKSNGEYQVKLKFSGEGWRKHGPSNKNHESAYMWAFNAIKVHNARPKVRKRVS